MQSNNKLKIVFLANYYGMYLNSFSIKQPHINRLTYEEGNCTLMNDYFGAFCSYSSTLNNFGHNSQVIVSNFEVIQKKWAEENHYKFDENNWQKDIALKQIEKIKPDVIFLGSNFELYDDFLDQIKVHCKLLVAWTSCPIPNNISHKKFDLVFTSLPYYVDNFRAQSIECELLNAAFDKNILDQVTTTKNIDFSFIGGFSVAHRYRYDIVLDLVKKVNLQVYGYGLESNRFIKSFHYNSLKRKIKKPVFGIEMYQKLQSSKITLNVHAELAKDNSVNMRLFEATGIGTLLLTDYTDSLNVYFEPEKEVITFKSKEEAVDKVKYYLKNETLRNTIAMKGQERTLNCYNYQITTTKMLNSFRKLL